MSMSGSRFPIASDHMLSGTRASVAVKIFGRELDVLRALAEQVQAAMGEIPSVVDLASDRQADVPVLTVRFRRGDLARYGIPAGERRQGPTYGLSGA